MLRSLLLDELTSRAIREQIDQGATTVIVPLGATEQHGPALPLLVDSEHGRETALRAAHKLGKTLVGPVVTIGYSPEHAAFAGTVSLSIQTLTGIIQDIAASHVRSGFRLIYFWVAHGGNFAVLKDVLPLLQSQWPGYCVTGLENLEGYVRDTWDTAPLKEGIALSVAGSHAGEFETSIMLATRPELVRMELAEAGNPRPLGEIQELMTQRGIQAVAANGVLGDQRAGQAARGDRYLEVLAEYLAADVRRHLPKIQ